MVPHRSRRECALDGSSAVRLAKTTRVCAEIDTYRASPLMAGGVA